MKAKLIIELDGASHDTRQDYDRNRDAYLHRQGYTIIRFANEEIARNTLGVVETIIMQVEKMLIQKDTGAQVSRPLP